MASIELKNIVKKYGTEVIAVDHFSLDIADREFLVLVGPSGCGKSTVLRMIAGLEDITAGELCIGGRPVNHVASKDRNIAMVFQNYALYPHMNVYKNMEFGLKMRKMDKSVIQDRILATARQLQIEELLKRKPSELSGGQRQRVALGRAMVREPEVFLLDEPLSNLDAKLRTEMRVQISRLHKQLETTFVYVTHDQTEAMTMADRIVVMKDGIIQQTGAPHDIYQNPANLFVAGFIGSPRMNFLPAQIVGRTAERVGGTDERIFSLLLCEQEYILPEVDFPQEILRGFEGREVVAAIRPEELVLEQESAGPLGKAALMGKTALLGKAAVLLTEDLGSEFCVYLDYRGHELTAKLSHSTMESSIEGAQNKRNEFFIEFYLQKLHLFDRETGVSLFCEKK